jgi:hypothetical protein
MPGLWQVPAMPQSSLGVSTLSNDRRQEWHENRRRD